MCQIDAMLPVVLVMACATRQISSCSSSYLVRCGILLMQSSMSNDDLTTLTLLDESANAGAGALLCKDGSGRSIFASDSCWVRKFPKATYKKGVNIMEWTLDTGVLNIYLGGN